MIPPNPGQRVHITEGAFTGYDGVVMTPEEVADFNDGRFEENSEEVWARVSVFGQEVRVRLPAMWVRLKNRSGA